MPDNETDDKFLSKPHLAFYVGIGVVIVIAAVVGLRTYRTIETNLTNAALSGRNSIACLAATTLSEEFQRFVDLGRSLSSRVNFSRLVTAGRWDDAIEIMKSIPGEFTYVEQVFIADRQGVLRASYPDSADEIGTNLSAKPWYSGVTKEWTSYLSPIYSLREDKQHRGLAVAVPVRGADGTPVGILVLRARFDRFFDWTRNLQLGRGGAIYVVDNAGRVAYDSSELEFSSIVDLSQQPPVRQVIAGRQGVEIQLSKSGAREVVAFAPADLGWGTIIRWPYDAVFAARDDQLRHITAAWIILTILILAVLYLVMRSLAARRHTLLQQRANADLERRVAERTAELQRSNEDLESFGYSVSHDLRAPLRVIDGCAAVLEQDYATKLEKDGTRLVLDIRGHTARMSTLIDELLNLARLRAIKVNAKPIAMQNLAREVVNDVSKAASCVPKIEMLELPDASGDLSLIRQVWTNLIDNAVKYSRDAPNPVVRISGEHKGDHVDYCVADNGVGFDMGEYNDLYKPFSRLRSAAKFSGSGVGLVIVKRIVECHHGRTWAESEPNKGTRMYFSLPIADNLQ